MEPVAYALEDGVAVLSICNPPVNALGFKLRRALAAALERAESDDAAQAVVLIGDGRGFAAGADLTEFRASPEGPQLSDLCNRIESSAKPVVAALHGAALGGGFELALAAHYRVALRGARVGLPEITLGLVPGAGGTQRLPRLIGAGASLDMMLSGRPVPVEDPGLDVVFDHIAETDLRGVATAFARDLVARGTGPRPTRDRAEGFDDPAAYLAVVAERAKAIARRPERAAHEILRCVEAAVLLPFGVGLDFEGAAGADCLETDQARALRHAVLAERRAARFPELPWAQPLPLRRIGVAGSGPSATGAAAAALLAGYPVVLCEADDVGRAAARARITEILDRAEARGLSSVLARDEQSEHLRCTADSAALAGCDMVIAGLPGDRHARGRALAGLAGIVPAGTPLVPVGPADEVAAMARACDRRRDVLGLHLYPPFPGGQVAELVVGDATSPAAVAALVGLVRAMGRIPVHCADRGGLIGQSVFAALSRASDLMLEDGADPYEIDAALRGWGMALGPYQMRDLDGLDRGHDAGLGAEGRRGEGISARLRALGRLGRRSGAGVYRHDAGGPGQGRGTRDMDVLALIETMRRERGIAPRHFSRDEMRRRCLAAMANEGARLLASGVALRPSDIDVVMLHGFGFPRWRGGPMMAADLCGLAQVMRDLQEFSESGDAIWTPHPVLARLAEAGQGFDVLNRQAT